MTLPRSFTLFITVGITFEQLHSYPQTRHIVQSYSYLTDCLQLAGTQG